MGDRVGEEGWGEREKLRFQLNGYLYVSGETTDNTSVLQSPVKMDLRGPIQVKTESRAQCKAGDPWPTPCAQLDGYNCDVPPTLDFHS